MNSFDPEFYSISVRKEVFEDELVYVARIQEFPDVLEFADSYEEARELALDTLITSYELLTEQGITFPEPMAAPQDAASGRITLRMPKTLHARLIEMAQREEVSLNQYIVSNLSMNYGQCNSAYVQSVEDLFFKFCVPHCAMLWYAEFFGAWNDQHENYKWQSLTNACAQQHVDVSDLTAHRALADCEMTRRLIHTVNSQLENQTNQNCDGVTNMFSE